MYITHLVVLFGFNIYIYAFYCFFLFSTRPHPAERRWLHTSILILSTHGSHDSHQTPSPWTEPLSATDHKNCEKRVQPCNRSLLCGLPFWDWVRTRAWLINSSGLESESRLLPITFYGMKSTKPALEAWPCCVFKFLNCTNLSPSHSECRPCRMHGRLPLEVPSERYFSVKLGGLGHAQLSSLTRVNMSHWQ